MKKEQVKVLSIDWDCFFTADMLDQYCTACSWNYSCNCTSDLLCDRRYSRPLLQPPNDHYQQVRYRSGRPPLEQLFSLGETILSSKMDGARLVVMDCHADLYHLLGYGSAVVNIDSHDDVSHWGSTEINCASWAERGLDAGRISCYQWIRNFSAVEKWDKQPNGLTYYSGSYHLLARTLRLSSNLLVAAVDPGNGGWRFPDLRQSDQSANQDPAVSYRKR
jgi:hypothetical protein